MIQRLPVSLQTLYADLVDRSWSGSYGELIQAGGSPYKRTLKGRDYWYLKMPMVAGQRSKDLYLGPDSDEIQKRVSQHLDLKAVRKDRLDMVRALRQARIPGPDPVSGNILSALSEAGVFRLRAVVVGTVAFQAYGPMMGVRFENTAGQTGDLDLAQFHSVSISVGDEIDGGILAQLKSVDPRFEPIPSPFDGTKALRYAIRVGGQELFAVDLLCPLRGPDRGSTTSLKAMQGDAQLLRYLDFLIYGEINAVVLHGIGVPVNIPAPERYAVHKLIVSRMRIGTAQSQTKARKDLVQAQTMIEVLLEDRRHELQEVWNEALRRGPKWEEKLMQAAGQLAHGLGDRLIALTEDRS
ncbi:nucleotidyltransferase family protein [Fuscibacter oryzae]|uniref:Nucleotidyltransferase-like domain-containing protein n=1 Tax=Fuscibacter oryzae TaxID=2803939 RepID=A0A8J7SU89_9RHOB|nr:GSU2403 family nucleotidyltransferase fold protein [Fuscibacter oryzae]MBL4930051.1 hypothetical protein [Fuscibacter oryzae]